MRYVNNQMCWGKYAMQNKGWTNHFKQIISFNHNGYLGQANSSHHGPNGDLSLPVETGYLLHLRIVRRNDWYCWKLLPSISIPQPTKSETMNQVRTHDDQVHWCSFGSLFWKDMHRLSPAPHFPQLHSPSPKPCFAGENVGPLLVGPNRCP